MGATPPRPVDVVASMLGEAVAVRPSIVGITGPVSVGKSTLAAEVAGVLPGDVRVVGTDGFLFPNAVLEARGLIGRKGRPETYDVDALRVFLDRLVARQPANAPVYSHVTYDVTAELIPVGVPDVVVLDGLHLASPDFGVGAVGSVVFVDAADDVLEEWYVRRFRQLVRDAHDAGDSGFAYYRSLDPDDCDQAARWVWHTVNLPNVEAQRPIGRANADLVVDLTAERAVAAVTRRA
jgi:type I pantothenate kinase